DRSAVVANAQRVRGGADRPGPTRRGSSIAAAARPLGLADPRAARLLKQVQMRGAARRLRATAYWMYVERAVDGGNAADGPVSATWPLLADRRPDALEMLVDVIEQDAVDDLLAAHRGHAREDHSALGEVGVAEPAEHRGRRGGALLVQRDGLRLGNVGVLL